LKLSARKTIHPNIRPIEVDDTVRKIKTPSLENRKGGALKSQKPFKSWTTRLPFRQLF
jgi:hypothetical protein